MTTTTTVACDSCTEWVTRYTYFDHDRYALAMSAELLVSIEARWPVAEGWRFKLVHSQLPETGECGLCGQSKMLKNVLRATSTPGPLAEKVAALPTPSDRAEMFRYIGAFRRAALDARSWVALGYADEYPAPQMPRDELDALWADCERFVVAFWPAIAAYDAHQTGHDFHLTRIGHEFGFSHESRQYRAVDAAAMQFAVDRHYKLTN